MTSLIRGFDESIREQHQRAGPEHDLPDQVSGVGLAGRRRLRTQICPAAEPHGRRTPRRSRSSPRRSTTSTSGSAANGEIAGARVLRGRSGRGRWRSSGRPSSSPPSTWCKRRNWPLLHSGRGRSPPARGGARLLRRTRRSSDKSGLDPIGKKVRIGAVGVHRRRRAGEAAVDTGGDRDDFVVIPQTTHQVLFNTHANRGFRGGQSATIVIIPHEDATRDRRSRRRRSRRGPAHRRPAPRGADGAGGEG